MSPSRDSLSWIADTVRPIRGGNLRVSGALNPPDRHRRARMGRGILLWMLGVPIPVILLLAMCSHH
jgi:hypothetical protein